MVASVTTTSSCFHCGNIVENTFVFDQKTFCCEGCKTVYQVLQEHDLAGFYAFDREKLSSHTLKGLAEFEWLQDAEVIAKLINFKSEHLCKVSFKAPAIHCSSCIWLLEHLYKIHKGVLRSEVDFVKKEIYIDYDPKLITLQELVYVLSKIGYEPEITLSDISAHKPPKSSSRTLWYKMGVAGFAFGNIMLLSLPAYFGLDVEGADHHLDLLFKGLNVALSVPVLFYAASDFLRSAYRALRHGQVNLDVPLCMGMLALYGNSFYEIFSGTGPGYLDSFTALVFFLLTGRAIQQVLMDRMRFEKDHSSFFPLSALRIEKGKERHVPITKLQVGDRVLVRHQELIPADGILIEGAALIDYSFVTGEALPVTKIKNECVYAGGRQVGGAVELILSKLPSQGYLMQLWDQNRKDVDEVEDFASVVNRGSKYFTYGVMAVALAALSYWTYAEGLGKGIWVMATTLNVSCPCALAVAIPFAYASVMRHLARNQFFVKNPKVIERITHLDAIAFDKTGTLTDTEAPDITYEGKPLSTTELCVLKAGLRQSVHPLSRQLYRFISESPAKEVRCEEVIGRGLKIIATDGCVYKVGALEFVAAGLPLAPESKAGVWISVGEELMGRFIFNPQYVHGLSNLVDSLKASGYRLALISGDHAAEKATLQRLFGGHSTLLFEQKPEDKLFYVRSLQQQGHKVMMVGDGLNDALSLSESYVGVAVVQEHSQFSLASDVVIARQALGRLDQLIRYCKSSLGVVKASFVYATCYNVLGLTFAVQGLFSPAFAAILMPVSSVTVVLFATMLTNWKAKQILK